MPLLLRNRVDTRRRRARVDATQGRLLSQYALHGVGLWKGTYVSAALEPTEHTDAVFHTLRAF